MIESGLGNQNTEVVMAEELNIGCARPIGGSKVETVDASMDEKKRSEGGNEDDTGRQKGSRFYSSRIS